ncbi:PQ loop repeat-domain-containing protein [Mycena rebaudengoi]|nr:PQ loop repeat-domain-containing protein [Mycena rebaudengoi]
MTPLFPLSKVLPSLPFLAMVVNAVAENAFGTLGAICWTVQLLPQIWKSWREKSTLGLSPWLVLLWGIAAAFLGAYSIILNLNIPLILQPQLFGILSLVSWSQCQYYEHNRSQKAAFAMGVGMMLLVGGFESLMVFTTRPSYLAGSVAAARAVQFFGISSSVLISVALLPQYVEIWRHREVVGISITFMVVDMLGGVFSDLSLAFKESFDIVAGVAYTLVVVLDGAIIIAAFILNPRAAKRRRRNAETGEMAEVATLGPVLVAPTPEPSSATITRAATPLCQYPLPDLPENQRRRTEDEI